MKIRPILASAVLALSACATNLIGMETQALEAVTATRILATQQLRAGKISRTKHEEIFKWADTTRDAIVAAVKANDPVQVKAVQKDVEAFKTELGKL